MKKQIGKIAQRLDIPEVENDQIPHEMAGAA